MLYRYCKRTRDFLGVFIFILVYLSMISGRFTKIIIPVALVGYGTIIANLALRTSLAI